MIVSDQMQSFDERVVMPKAAIFAGGLTRYLSYVLRRTDFIGLRQRCLEWGTMIFVQTIGGQLAAEKEGMAFPFLASHLLLCVTLAIGVRYRPTYL